MPFFDEKWRQRKKKRTGKKKRVLNFSYMGFLRHGMGEAADTASTSTSNTIQDFKLAPYVTALSPRASWRIMGYEVINWCGFSIFLSQKGTQFQITSEEPRAVQRRINSLSGRTFSMVPPDGILLAPGSTYRFMGYEVLNCCDFNIYVAQNGSQFYVKTTNLAIKPLRQPIYEKDHPKAFGTTKEMFVLNPPPIKSERLKKHNEFMKKALKKYGGGPEAMKKAAKSWRKEHSVRWKMRNDATGHQDIMDRTEHTDNLPRRKEPLPCFAYKRKLRIPRWVWITLVGAAMISGTLLMFGEPFAFWPLS